MDFGEYTILLERGKHIFVVIVFSGMGETEVRRLTRRTIDEVEEKYGKTLEDWGGEMSHVAGIRDIVRKKLLRA